MHSERNKKITYDRIVMNMSRERNKDKSGGTEIISIRSDRSKQID
jgi:hypothetical protein